MQQIANLFDVVQFWLYPMFCPEKSSRGKIAVSKIANVSSILTFFVPGL